MMATHAVETGKAVNPTASRGIGAVGSLQRKCACGGTPGPTGECEACKKKRLGLQTKLKINQPGDIYEQEADRIADQVMAAPTHPGVSDAPPRIQRFSGQFNSQMDAALASVDQAIADPGRPLEPALRQDMEQRFGYDFSRVRVHSGAAAEQSARDVNAYAYTVGQDIVFGAGWFAPHTQQGRRLLAHELTHSLQQTGNRGANTLDPVAVRAFSGMPMLSRACNAVKCPTVALPVGVFVPSWQLAEQCLQDHYKESFPNSTVGFNKDFVGLTGKNPNEQANIDCFAKYYTGKGYKPKGARGSEPFDPKEIEREGSAQRQAEPDIFDFTNKKIMEITTPNGLAYRAKKVVWEVEEATKLSEECHIPAPNQWAPGFWEPEPCYQLVGAGSSLAGKLFFRVWRVGGILVYVPVFDVTREALAVATSTALIMLWKGGGAALAQQAVRLAGSLGPRLAVETGVRTGGATLFEAGTTSTAAAPAASVSAEVATSEATVAIAGGGAGAIAAAALPLVAMVGVFVALGSGYAAARKAVRDENTVSGFSEGFVMALLGWEWHHAVDRFGRPYLLRINKIDEATDVIRVNAYNRGLKAGYVTGAALPADAKKAYLREIRKFTGPRGSTIWSREEQISYVIQLAAVARLHFLKPE
jgi:Domain of unknown function (DUF4157)